MNYSDKMIEVMTKEGFDHDWVKKLAEENPTNVYYEPEMRLKCQGIYMVLVDIPCKQGTVLDRMTDEFGSADFEPHTVIWLVNKCVGHSKNKEKQPWMNKVYKDICEVAYFCTVMYDVLNLWD